MEQFQVWLFVLLLWIKGLIAWSSVVLPEHTEAMMQHTRALFKLGRHSSGAVSWLTHRGIDHRMDAFHSSALLKKKRAEATAARYSGRSLLQCLWYRNTAYYDTKSLFQTLSNYINSYRLHPYSGYSDIFSLTLQYRNNERLLYCIKFVCKVNICCSILWAWDKRSGSLCI
jgi:hypothetical protein